jgi:hypothetical protein
LRFELKDVVDSAQKRGELPSGVVQSETVK